MRPRKRSSSGGQSESDGRGQTRARVARTGNPCRREPPIKAVAEKKRSEATTAVPRRGLVAQRGEPAAGARQGQRREATNWVANRRASPLHQTTVTCSTNTSGKDMCKRQRAEIKTDGAAIEERQRRHDQSGSGGCATDGAANPPELGAGRRLTRRGGDAGAQPSWEPVGRGRAKRAHRASVASSTNRYPRPPAHILRPRARQIVRFYWGFRWFVWYFGS